MTTIQLPNQIIGTDRKPKAALEKFKDRLYEYIDANDQNPEIDIDAFIDELTTCNNDDDTSDFDLVDEDAIAAPDIVITEEDLDALIEDYLEYGDETEDLEEDEYVDEAEEEPELFEDEEDEEDDQE